MRGCAAAALVCAASCGGSPAAPAPPPTPQLTVSCPAAVETSSLGGVPVAVTYAAPTATGGVAPVTVACAPAAGTPFPTGATTVTCTASDNGGRQASCTFGVTVANIPLRLRKTRFMAFGDSLTEGKLRPFGADFQVDGGPHSYPSILKRLLTERYAGQTVTVENEGFGGEPAVKSFERFLRAIATHSPEVLLLMHGVNDLIGEGGEDAKIRRTADTIDELVEIALDRGLTVFVATLPPFGPGGKASCQECVAPLNDRIRSSAAARGAVLVDVFAAWGGKPDPLMGPDGIHPTEAGYEAIAKAFFEAIQRTLEAPPLGGRAR
jgi:lysophospholipase L1-like esterase